MSLVVSDDFAHVSDVFFLILGRIFARVLFQDLNDHASTSTEHVRLSHNIGAASNKKDTDDILELTKRPSYLSWPTDSPDPSSLDHPDSVESSLFNQSSSSSADMFTVSFHSLDEMSLFTQACGR